MRFGELFQSGNGFDEQIPNLGMTAYEMAKFSARSGCKQSSSQMSTGVECPGVKEQTSFRNIFPKVWKIKPVKSNWRRE